MAILSHLLSILEISIFITSSSINFTLNSRIQKMNKAAAAASTEGRSEIETTTMRIQTEAARGMKW